MTNKSHQTLVYFLIQKNDLIDYLTILFSPHIFGHLGTTNPPTLDIISESAPKYQWACDGNESNVETYGRLYTWYATTDSRNICPKGWHVPTDAEWTTLTDYLIKNGYGFGGSGAEIAKSMAATSGWTTNSIPGSAGNDLKSNNNSGFTGHPGGYRYGSGSFNDFESHGYWWLATELYPTSAWYWSLNDLHNDVYRGSSSKQNGVSVRCLRDK
jgi:uncharacterized protein (TIGR02145 family)